MRKRTIYLTALLACAALTTEAHANGRLILNGAKWAGSAIAGGVLYDTVKPDSAEAAAPGTHDERRPPAYGPASGARPMTDVCIVPGLGSCPLPYPIPAGTPCRCY